MQIGDVFSFALADDRVVFMRCVGISGDDRDNQPTVEVLDWSDSAPPPDPATLAPRRAIKVRSGDYLLETTSEADRLIVVGGKTYDRHDLERAPDLFHLVRYPSDPDPAERITILATGTAITRRSALPATLVAWTDIVDAIKRTFGEYNGGPEPTRDS